MQSIGNRIQKLRRDERGLTTVEYAIVLCLIAALAVVSWKKFGQMVDDKLTGAKDHVGEQLDKGLPGDG
jgi:Flp pilus assembly pilin Flp